MSEQNWNALETYAPVFPSLVCYAWKSKPDHPFTFRISSEPQDFSGLDHLAQRSIRWCYLPDLGGRARPQTTTPCQHNWRHIPHRDIPTPAMAGPFAQQTIFPQPTILLHCTKCCETREWTVRETLRREAYDPK